MCHSSTALSTFSYEMWLFLNGFDVTVSFSRHNGGWEEVVVERGVSKIRNEDAETEGSPSPTFIQNASGYVVFSNHTGSPEATWPTNNACPGQTDFVVLFFCSLQRRDKWGRRESVGSCAPLWIIVVGAGNHLASKESIQRNLQPTWYYIRKVSENYKKKCETKRGICVRLLMTLPTRNYKYPLHFFDIWSQSKSNGRWKIQDYMFTETHSLSRFVQQQHSSV